MSAWIRAAADLVHSEARWCMEQERRGETPNAVDALLKVERMIRRMAEDQKDLDAVLERAANDDGRRFTLEEAEAELRKRAARQFIGVKPPKP